MRNFLLGAAALRDAIRLWPGLVLPLFQIKTGHAPLTRIDCTSVVSQGCPMSVLVASSPLAARLAAKLGEREAELRALLQRHAGAAVGAAENPPEVLDFKDVAAEDLRAIVDEATLANATAELRQIVAARRRVGDGSYGECQDCGEPIDERRLLALPATAYCTACQAIHERPAMPRR
jgi:DnaK suppressor protein